jgi:pimeloyl-ACP methyl ester carboxylesterase
VTEIEAVTFRNDQGQTLFGTIHTPSAPRPDAPAVVLMSPGVKMRVGPGRLYVPITELLTSRGHTVLRFDFFGLGDSEGELTETALMDVYSHIEAGRYAADAAAALQWMRRERGHTRFIVGGLCGGAITALYAAQRDPGVEALLSIGMTVTMASDAVRPAAYFTTAELVHRRRGYLRRLLQPKSWWRLLTLQSELGVIWLSLYARADRPTRPAPLPEGTALTPEQLGNINPQFPEAFFEFLGRGGRALMLFSEKDRLYAEYQDKFVALHESRLQRHATQVTEHLVPGANHVLSQREWQEEMLAETARWLGGLPRG